MNLVLLLVVVPLLIALNGFFVAAEYALVRSRVDRLEQLEEEGRKRATLARLQIGRIDQYIAACQVGVTLASIGIGAVGEPVFAHYLEKPFGHVLGHGAAVALAAILAYMVISASHITFGELSPKIYTVAFPEHVMLRSARLLQFSSVVFRPVSIVLSAAARRILRPFGIRAEGLGEEITTSEDHKFLIARSASGGTLAPA